MLTLKSICVVVGLTAISITGASAADLAEAKQQLQKWQDRFATIRVVSHRESFAETSSLLRHDGKEHSLSERDWIWEDSGRFLNFSTAIHDGKISRSDQRADSRHSYYIKYSPDDPVKEIPAMVYIRENTLENTGASLLYPPFHFLWDEGTRTWLGTRLAQATESRITDDGLLEIDGAEIGIEHFQILLDPEHGYLPKQGSNPGAGGVETRFVVDQFQEVEPGFWFPEQGTLVLRGGEHDIQEEWWVSNVELNNEYPESRFQPPMGETTFVRDSIQGKSYWYAGKPPASLIAKRNEAAKAASAPVPEELPENVVTAEPEGPVRWTLWLGLCGLLLLGAGLLIRRRA